MLVEGSIGAILLLLTGRRAGLARLSGPDARELSAGSSASPGQLRISARFARPVFTGTPERTADYPRKNPRITAAAARRL